MELNDQLVANEPKKMTLGINILTILTFIGSAWELYSAVSSYFTSSKALEEFDKAQEKLSTAPAFVRKLAGPEARELMAKSIENKVPLLIISLIAISLCVYGAIEMRKLKKQGYALWLIGEVLPYIALFLFVGTIVLKTVVVYFMFFPLLFILLYTLQRKHLN
ncbi:MAG: hypothetical protein WCJ85_05975 [Chitinophagaceae bacterium]